MSFLDIFGIEDKFDCVADQEYKGNQVSIFNGDVHKKSLNKYEFVDTSNKDLTAEHGNPKKDADRSPSSQEAYHEFMEGLRQINQQEYLYPEEIGMLDEKSMFSMCGNPQKVEFKGRTEQLKEVRKAVPVFATWLRTMEERAHAYSAQLFYNHLLSRSRMNLHSPQKPTLENAYLSPWRTGNIPIRTDTAKYLTRLPEYDYTLMGVIMMAVSMVILLFTLITQIMTIASICSVAFFCPSNALTDHWPVVAPPVMHRVSAGTTIISPELLTNPVATNSCTFDEPDCSDPGYLVQWPYLQKTTVQGARANTYFPESLKTACTQVVKGETGWMFNPFNLSLMEEFWDCDSDVIPFREEAAATAGNATEARVTDFHFDTKWYKSNNEKTLECMESALSDNTDFSNPSDWDRADADLSDELQVAMTSCMRSKSIDDSRRCQCDQYKYANYPIKFFYVQEPSRICDGGPNDGELCDLVNTTCPQGSCVYKYPEQQHVSRSIEFGCFFTSPTSTRVPVDYVPCGFQPAASIINRLGFTLEDNDLKKAFDVQVSRRTALILIFFAKEGSFVTGFIICAVILAVTLALAFVVSLLLKCLPAIGFSSPEKKYLVTSIAILVKDLVRNYISIIWSMCLNFSTTYRILVMLYQIRTGDVNPSIKDMEKKLTSVSNTVYNLILLVALSEGDGIDSGVVASLVLTLVLLLLQMNTEMFILGVIRAGLSDLNENRLSKFETALLWIKIMEDFLVADVQFNFVQLFKSKQPLKPFDVQFPEVIGPQKEKFDETMATKDRGPPLDEPIMEVHSEDQEGLQRKVHDPARPRAVLRKFIHDSFSQNEQAGVYHQAMRSLTKKEMMVGHDGRGSQASDPTLQCVKLEPTNEKLTLAMKDTKAFKYVMKLLKDGNPIDYANTAVWEWMMLCSIQVKLDPEENKAKKQSTTPPPPQEMPAVSSSSPAPGDFLHSSLFKAYGRTGAAHGPAAVPGPGGGGGGGVGGERLLGAAVTELASGAGVSDDVIREDEVSLDMLATATASQQPGNNDGVRAAANTDEEEEDGTMA